MKQILSFLFLVVGLFFNSAAQNADINLLREINLNRNPSLDKAFSFISSTYLPASIAVPAGLLIGSYLSDDKKMRMIALQTTCAEVLNFGLTEILKNTIRRPRPYITYPEIENYNDAGGYSFPSGHSSAAFTIATSLSLNYPKWYVIAPSYAWAILVSYSRLHLGVHYPSDVLAGILLGAGSSYLCFKAQKWLQKKSRPQASNDLK